MNIKILQDKIVINNPSTFIPKHILDSGQVFRYRELTDSSYELIAKDKRCEIISLIDRVEIITDDATYFINYFDLNTDYSMIINTLNTEYNLHEVTFYGRGIRILRQDPLETVISFIISANNNIKRIKGIIDRLCKAIGTDMGGYYAFPTLNELASKREEFYNSIGAGYRGRYLYQTVQMLAGGFSLNLDNMNTREARKHIMNLCGVGRKVAECILLFAYYRMDVFPVDTWITKVYREECDRCVSTDIMSDYLIGKYGKLSGYAQQYLFYYKRENKI